jgi:hypothetical protein
MTEEQNLTTKFYSQRAITIASYFGSPLAAGYLIRQNFVALGKEDYGNYSMLIGIISTLLIFIGVFSIPELIMNKIPNTLIPLIYTAIIYLINEKLQGKDLKEQKKNNGEFYSAWKAVGIGAICLVILFAGIFGYLYLKPDDFDSKKYDSKFAIFSQNEGKALELFDKLQSKSRSELIDFIDKNGIAKWDANLKILSELDKLDGIYEPLIKQDQILRNYCNLRIEQFQMIRKAIISNTEVDEIEMQKIVKKIDNEIAKLEK